MKTNSLALLLLAIFFVSSLEAVWADESFDIEEFEDSEDVSINDVSEIEEAEYNILSKSSCKSKKVKSHHHQNGRCLSSNCKETCKNDGFKTGKCTASEDSDKVKKCYCIKSCHKKHKKDKKHNKDTPSSPPTLPPADVPSFVVPEYAPTNSPSINIPDFPIRDFPDLPPTMAPMSHKSFEDEDSDISDIY